MKSVFIRPDLSEWVVHFVHDRNPSNEPEGEGECGDSGPEFFPYHADPAIDARFSQFKYDDQDDSRLVGDSSSFEVLKKIVEQGVIKGGWAFRNGKPTIYGPKSAVCFSEMPLSSLVEYAKQRRNSRMVGLYCIGLKKNELFRSGARPVIYGLSGQHRETGQGQWPRFLDPACGIAEAEQFRYVALNLHKGKRVDWTHEREWRWADHLNACEVPGVPVWYPSAAIAFSEVIVVVSTRQEADQIIELLQEYYDRASASAADYTHRPEVLKRTCVIAVEELKSSSLLRTGKPLNIEQVPSKYLHVASPPTPTQAVRNLIRQAVEEAREASRIACQGWMDSDRRDVCGWAQLLLSDSMHVATRAALEEGLVDPRYAPYGFGSGGYSVLGVADDPPTQDLGAQEAGARAAQQVISRYFPDLSTWVHTRWD